MVTNSPSLADAESVDPIGLAQPRELQSLNYGMQLQNEHASRLVVSYLNYMLLALSSNVLAE